MENLIKLLNEAVKAEYQAIHQYNNHYNNVRDKHPEIIDHFKEHMDDELGHANQLVARIYTMGGVPTIEMKPVAEYTENIEEALKQDIIGEQEAIDLYTSILDYCDEIHDRATTVMIEAILTDEVSHLDEFAKLRRSTVIR